MMDLDLFGVIEGPYRDRIGREYESVQVPWHTVAAILGRGLYGQVCDDLKIVAVLIERGYPRWLEECEEGWVDDYGVGYIGPSLDGESMP